MTCQRAHVAKHIDTGLGFLATLLVLMVSFLVGLVWRGSK